MKFLVCYDNSEMSKFVVKRAQKHAQVWDATLEIVQVVKRDQPIEHSKLLEMEETIGDDIRSLFKNCKIQYKFQMLVDDIDEGSRMIELAQRKKVDLIFLGLKKRSKVGKMLFGSNAQQIILNSPCPVISFSHSAKDSN